MYGHPGLDAHPPQEVTGRCDLSGPHAWLAIEASSSLPPEAALSLRQTRIALPELRWADPTSLLVMTQDLMNRSIVHLDGATLADIFALAELEDALPRHIHRDLDRIARGKERELKDLPDGPPLREQLDQFVELLPAHVPTRLREAVAAVRVGRQLEAATTQLIEALLEHWEGVEPERPEPGKATKAQVERPAVPKRLRMPDDPVPSRQKRIRAAKADSETPAKATPAAKVDQGRADWIRQHLLERLAARREQGLKESILVAAACHNSPYSDMQRSEVLAELRELKRQGTVKNTAGRWIRVQRLGW
jgi:hypothetical protein